VTGVQTCALPISEINMDPPESILPTLQSSGISSQSVLVEQRAVVSSRFTPGQ